MTSGSAVFVDTSALYALLDPDDENHERATRLWSFLTRRREPLITTNYVLVELMSLAGRRLGLHAVRDFQSELAPVLQAMWIDQYLHQQAVTALMTAGMRDLSLVDCASFEVMRRMDTKVAFAFDVHFDQQGFSGVAET